MSRRAVYIAVFAMGAIVWVSLHNRPAAAQYLEGRVDTIWVDPSDFDVPGIDGEVARDASAESGRGEASRSTPDAERDTTAMGEQAERADSTDMTDTRRAGALVAERDAASTDATSDPAADAFDGLASDTTDVAPDTSASTRPRRLDALTQLPPAPPAPPSGQFESRGDTVSTREVDISADLLEGAVEDGERVRRLTGNVRLRQDETRLRARRAIQYLDRREILFLGDVEIVERGDTLRADSVLYNRRDKTGRANGRVRLSDGDVLVRAPSGLYYTREKRAEFTAGVTLIDSTAELTSDAGQYWSDEKRAEFYGRVELREDRTFLQADSVTYLRETDVSHARGNVFIERYGDSDNTAADSLTRSLLFGDQAYNEDSTAYSRIEGHPLLIQLRQDSVGAPVDTLLIRARILESSRIDSLRRLIAIDSVYIWQSDLAATADSVVYDRIEADSVERREIVRLFDGPLAWFQNTQVSGDTLLLRGRRGKIDSLLVRSNAFVARRDTALDKIHQLKGRDLDAAFEDDSLRTLSIGPQAEAVNYRSDDEGASAGAVRLSADRIHFQFEGDDLKRLEAIRGTEGTYYSEVTLPSDLSLEGFLWRPDLRPTKEHLLQSVEVPTHDPVVAMIPYTPSSQSSHAPEPSQAPD